MPVSISGGSLRIDDFETHDHTIISHFSELPDVNHDNEVARLLKLGILAQGAAGAGAITTYVETELNRLQAKMTNDIDRVFGENGEVHHKMEGYFGETGSVRDFLNLDKDGAPLYKLHKDLQDGFSSLRDHISTMSGQLKMARKSPQKGFEFEDMCKPEICSMADGHSDSVDHVGGTPGDLRNKKGDFVVTISGTERRIVFEMKYKKRTSINEIREQLNEAMKNRRAEYAVLVSRNKDALPPEASWFNEYDGNKLVCAVSETDDSEVNMWVIRVAYRWARHRVVSNIKKDQRVDPEAVTKGIEGIEASLSRMEKVTNQCRNIEKSIGEIKRVMMEEEGIIKEEVEGIINSMNRPST